jgi:ethanolamine permease
VLLRRNLPNIDRPYRSKWGETGAIVAGVIAIVSLVSIFLNEDYLPGVYGVAIYYILGLIYFAIAGRKRLVLSPEEEFALTKGERGVPEVSYGTSAADQEAILGGGTSMSTSTQMPDTPAPPPPE